MSEDDTTTTPSPPQHTTDDDSANSHPLSGQLKSSLKTSKYSTSTSETQTNLNGDIINCTRYTLNFTITSEEKGHTGLRSRYMKMFSKMLEYCPSLRILLWNNDGDSGYITSPDKIPDTITQLQKYFEGARVYDSGGSVFSKIHLGLPIICDRTTFEANFSAWCQENDTRFYVAAVQHHNTRVACWLPYLTRFTNATVLSQIFTKCYKDNMKSDVPIGITWRALNGQTGISNKEKIRAIHVECPYDQTANVKAFLRSCSHQRKYPGGSRFRVMTEYWPYMTERNKQRHRYMADKHKYFLDRIEHCENNLILDIDRKIPSSNTTLRSLVLNIRDKNDKHRIFNSIDLRWNSNSVYILTFRPDKKSMAYDFSNSLSTYIRHLYPDSDLSKVFTLSAIERASQEIYHPDLQSFTTLEDIATLQELKNDEDDESLDYLDCSHIQLPDEDADDQPSIPCNQRIFELSGDSESVSTMATTDAMSVTFADDSSHISNDTSSAKTASSRKTSTSVGTRVTRVESASQQATDDMATMRSDLNKLMKSLKAKSDSNDSTSTQPMASDTDSQAVGAS